LILDVVEAGFDRQQFPALHLVSGLIFIVSASALTGSILARLKPSKVLERGAVLLDEGSPVSSLHTADTLTLAGHPIPLLDETKHFKTIGTTGTGKTTAIRELLSGAFARGNRAVIADPDGGYLRHFYNTTRGDIILNPFDPRAAHWDLFSEIILPHDADQLARSFIPDYDGQDRNWRGYARTYVTAILRQLHRFDEHNLATLYHLLVTAKEEDLCWKALRQPRSSAKKAESSWNPSVPSPSNT